MDARKTATQRLIWDRYRTLGEALQYGSYQQWLWNVRNLLSLVREIMK